MISFLQASNFHLCSNIQHNQGAVAVTTNLPVLGCNFLQHKILDFVNLKNITSLCFFL